MIEELINPQPAKASCTPAAAIIMADNAAAAIPAAIATSLCSCNHVDIVEAIGVIASATALTVGRKALPNAFFTASVALSKAIIAPLVSSFMV